MKKKMQDILSPVKGKVIPIEQVPDEIFAQKMLGDGVAVIPAEGRIYSPVDCKVVTITDSLHAYGLETEDGLQIIVHFGLETVALNGKGFTPHVKVGDQLKAGDLIADVDLDFLKKNKIETITPVVISGVEDLSGFDVTYGDVNAKQKIVSPKAEAVKKEKSVKKEEKKEKPKRKIGIDFDFL